MTSPPPLPPPPSPLSKKGYNLAVATKKNNKYETKANMTIEYFELNKCFAPPCACHISIYPLCLGRGACDPVCFLKHAEYPDPKLF